MQECPVIQLWTFTELDLYFHVQSLKTWLCLFIDVVAFIPWVGKLLWEMSSLNFSELPRIGCCKQDPSMAERLVTAAISDTEYKKKKKRQKFMWREFFTIRQPQNTLLALNLPEWRIKWI